MDGNVLLVQGIAKQPAALARLTHHFIKDLITSDSLTFFTTSSSVAGYQLRREQSSPLWCLYW